MIRTKVTVAFAIFIALFAAVSVVLVRMDVTEELEQAARVQANQGVATTAETLKVREAALLAQAELVARGDSLYKGMTGEIDLPEADQKLDEEGNPTLSFAERRHLVVHEKLTARSYVLEETLAAAGSNDPRNQGPARRPLFLALDVKGIGVAALGKDLFSWHGQDVTKLHKDVAEVIKSGQSRVAYWTWAFGKDEDSDVYQAAIVPIRRNEKDKVVGVVVLGAIVDGGIARAARNRIAGLAVDVKDDPLLDEAPQVLISVGDTVEASTINSKVVGGYAELLKAQGSFGAEPKAVGPVVVGENEYFAASQPVGTMAGKPVNVVVMSDLTAARSVLGAVTVNLVLVGIIIMLIGAGIILALILGFVRKIEELESGIQEVIAGNKDYQWELIKGHELQNSIAQSLNLMSAILQGKRAPDDEVEDEWSADMDPAGKSGPIQIQGVGLPMMQAMPKKPDDDSSSS